MKEINVIYTKPTLWCMLIHQVGWSETFDNEDITYCCYCKKLFFYPSKQKDNPVYTK